MPVSSRHAAIRAAWQVNLDSQRFDYISGTALGTDAAITVFGHSNPRPRNNESRGSRNIERAAGVSARTAGIDQRVPARTAQSEGLAIVGLQWRGLGANRLS